MYFQVSKTLPQTICSYITFLFANNPLPLLWSTFKRKLLHTLNSISTALMKCAEWPLHPALFYIEAFRNVKNIYPHYSYLRMPTFQIKLSSTQLVKITKIKTSHQCSGSCLPTCNEPDTGCQETAMMSSIYSWILSNERSLYINSEQ